MPCAAIPRRGATDQDVEGDPALLEMARALHSHLPEEMQPSARMDFSDAQWARLEAARAVILAARPRPGVQTVARIIDPIAMQTDAPHGEGALELRRRYALAIAKAAAILALPDPLPPKD